MFGSGQAVDAFGKFPLRISCGIGGQTGGINGRRYWEKRASGFVGSVDKLITHWFWAFIRIDSRPTDLPMYV